MRLRLRMLVLLGFMAGLLIATGSPASAQKAADKKSTLPTDKTPEKSAEKGNEKFENVSFLTADGLRLFGAWYPGSKGRNSDAVLMLPNYRKSYTDRGDWNPLAESLQKEGFSVLVFDYRGHGKSSTVKTFDDPKRFCDTYTYPWNKLTGLGLNPQKNPASLKTIDAKKFNDGIFPYLVNDIAAARKFLDNRNDASECNSGRINIIADRESCGLAMAWMATEFNRVAIYSNNQFDIPPRDHFGSKDLMSAVWLTYRPGLGQTSAVINKGIIADAVAGPVIRDKVSMAFIHGDGERDLQAAQWFSRWGIKGADEPSKGKFVIEVKNGKNLMGIDLCDPTKLDTVSSIIAFLKGAQKKNLAGTDWTIRNAKTDAPLPIHLDVLYNIKSP